MRIMITGGKGMLGRTLARRLAEHELHIADLPEVNICDLASLDAAVAALKPDCIIHCAAMTAVDKCETEIDLAYAVNAIGSRHVAIAADRHGARVIAISTDYVFSGDLDRPYREWDATVPKTVYGASKLAGEEEIRRHCDNHLILRIAWLYGPGGPSFVHTMCKLGAQGGDPMRVVNDQVGNPTSTDTVADVILALLPTVQQGTFHATCEGETSWYGFTQEIFRLRGITRGLVPCTTAEYPRPAPRPASSRLDKMALRLAGLPPTKTWQEALAQFFQENPEG